ncbi:MAG: family 16 glycosylhydrolase [Janthinobacterium lividum]
MSKIVFRLLLISLVAVGMVSTSYAQCKLHFDSNTWAEVYRDDFKQPTGLDTSEWWTSPSHGMNINDHSGWGSEWYDFNDPSLVTISNPTGGNGIVCLTAKRWLDVNGSPVDEKIVSPNGSTRIVRYRSGMLVSKSGGSWQGHSKEEAYGAWEARIKLPSNHNAWPAFWLWTSQTEIDIIDDTDGVGLMNNVIDWEERSSPSTPPRLTECARYVEPYYNRSTMLSDDFHIYSMVWTPETVTFFFDGREIRTLPSSVIATHDGYPDLLLTLQMRSKVGDAASPNFDPNETAQMYIDWVRILKPIPDASKNRNYHVAETTYKTSSEFVNHDITALTNAVAVKAEANSILVNPTNAGQVFYQGTDNNLYVATKIVTSWTVVALPVVPGSAAGGDLTYHQANQLLLYRGQDSRLHCYYLDSTGAWKHEWVTPFASVRNRQASLLKQQPGCLATHVSGRIAYLGQDNLLHFCDPGPGPGNQFPWGITTIPNRESNYAAATPRGDILFDIGSESIVYKGNDDRLQYYWPSNGIYQHTWADDNWNTSDYMVSRQPKSVAIADGYLFYIGRDDAKIHQLAYNGATNRWDPTILPSPSYVYGQGTGYPMADLALAGIEVNPGGNHLTYLGQDGRVQYLYLSNSAWHHTWMDDYWNTDEYLALSTAFGNHGNASLSTTGFDMAFYSGANNHLRYFEYEPCTAVTTCDLTGISYGTINRQARKANTQTTSTTEAPVASFMVYPNPTNGAIDVTLPATWHGSPTHYVLYSPFGQVLSEGNFTSEATSVNLAPYAAGMYLLRLQNGASVHQEKIIKQ